MLYRILVAILFKLKFINFSNNRKKLDKYTLHLYVTFVIENIPSLTKIIRNHYQSEQFHNFKVTDSIITRVDNSSIIKVKYSTITRVRDSTIIKCPIPPLPE
jgi:hypothetical protein